MENLGKRAVALLLSVLLLAGLLPAGLIAQAAEEEPAMVLLPVVNGGFEEVKEGPVDPAYAESDPSYLAAVDWTTSNVIDPGAMDAKSTTEEAYEGERSLKLIDTKTNASTGLRSPAVTVKPGYDYVARAWMKGTGKGDIYLEFVGQSQKKSATFEVDGDWTQHEVRFSNTQNKTGAQVLLYCNQANTGVIYFDQVELWEVTQTGILAELDEAILNDDQETAAGRLANGALALTDVDPLKAGDYLAALKEARTQAGRALSLPEIAAAVAEVNGRVDAENREAIGAVLAQLTGRTLELTETGTVPPPTVADGRGVALRWTAVEGDLQGRLLLDSTGLQLRSQPQYGQEAEGARVELTLEKGAVSEKIWYDVTIQPYSEALTELVQAAEAVTLESLLNGQDAAQVRETLTLPDSLEGISITWTSSNQAINPATGAVTRPAYKSADQAVTLTATFQKEAASYQRAYRLIVPGVNWDDARILPLQNGEFEDGLTGWTPTYPVDLCQATDEQVYLGSGAIKLDDPDAATKVGRESEKLFGAREGYQYQADAMVFSNTGAKAGVYLRFWDAQGVLLTSANKTYSKAGEWENVSVSGTAPAGTALVSVFLYSGTGTAGVTYVDNVRLRELPILRNGEFDLGITGWEETKSGAVTVEEEAGNAYLKLENKGSTRSYRQAAKQGVRYFVTAWCKVEGDAGKLELESVNGSGAKIASQSVAIPAQDWGPVLLIADLDPAATSLDVRFTAGTSGTLLVDRAEILRAPYSLQAAMENGTSNKLPVLAGKEYAAVSGAELKVGFYDNSGRLLGTEITAADGLWQGTAPGSAAYAVLKCAQAVEFYCLSTSLSNASFENTDRVLPGTAPYQWSPLGDAAVYSAGQENQYTDGFLGLGIRSFDNGEAGVRSSLVAIRPGEEYRAGVMARAEAGTYALKIEFWDGAFQQLTAETAPVAGSAWTPFEVTGLAPDGAAYASLSVTGSGAGQLYLDEASLAPVVKDIGQNTQLLIDDYLLEDLGGAVRTFHQAEKTGKILTPEYPWEGVAYVYGTVLYDEEEACYKMWYQISNSLVAYATSQDGVNWEKPLNLGAYKYDGSTDNNIIGMAGMLDSPDNGKFHIPNVFKDTAEPDPQKRYKMISFNFNYNGGESFYCLYTSPDGFVWTLEANAIPGWDVSTVAYDETNGKYVGMFKRSLEKRVHFMAESEDLKTWSEPIRMFSVATPLDAQGILRADCYGSSLYPTGDAYVGFDWRFLSTDDSYMYGTVDMPLMFSRDLTEDWQRPYGESIIPMGRPGSWDDEMLYGAQAPIRMGDELWLYYGGWDGDHGVSQRDAAIAIAKWRLDGFASLDSTAETELLTSPLTFDGEYLHVNANVKSGGSLRVELLDENGQVLPGYERENCKPITGNRVDRVVRWKDGDSLKDLAGETVRLRIITQNTELYSFGFKEYDTADPRPEDDGTPSASYRIELESSSFGELTSSDRTAPFGRVVRLTAKANPGSTLEGVTVTDRQGNAVELHDLGGGEYSFMMPASDVKAAASYSQQVSFRDVRPGDWFYEEVLNVAAQGLMTGTEKDVFSPGQPLTRAMAAVLLWRLEGSPSAAKNAAFADVAPGAWYADAVDWAAEQGIVQGMGGETFAPDLPVTRAQLVTLLHRYALWKKLDVPTGAALSAFSDAADVPDWAAQAFQWACGEGLIQGADGKLLPGVGMTRAEMAAVLSRFSRLLEK